MTENNGMSNFWDFFILFFKDCIVDFCLHIISLFLGMWIIVIHIICGYMRLVVYMKSFSLNRFGGISFNLVYKSDICPLNTEMDASISRN
jgi:hypothetical protein